MTFLAVRVPATHFLCFMRFAFLFVTLVITGLWNPANAQGNWTSTPGLLTTNYYVPAPPRPTSSYTDPVAIRSGQQDLFFNPGDNVLFQDMRVRVNGGNWEVLWSEDDGTFEGAKYWANVPTAPGEYDVDLRWTRTGGNHEFFNYRFLVVPPAQKAFSDGAGNTMVLWSDPSNNLLDSPLLVVEGIDAGNVNVESHYYALGLQLFESGRSRGADVMVLNFGDGGRDLRLNAEVVKSAIQFVNQETVLGRRLDVAGVSMGGVVVRYALADMEADGVAHEVGRFVSIDAPQQGAFVDAQLLNWMYNPPWYTFGKFEVPENIIGTAGKQLLQYNPFDTSNPKQHDLFYNELNALNGDGYPHLTEENIGVSFGTPNPNPAEGQWLKIEIDGAPDNFFFIEDGSPEDGAGSLLPREVTNIGGTSTILVVDISFGTVRTADPTFIPYESALDIVNGQSKFDEQIYPTNRPYYHSEVPPSIVEPLLVRLGYPEPPPPPPPTYSVSISGPSSVAANATATWIASASGGVPPYTYEWSSRYPCDPEPDPCVGMICTMDVPICEAFDPIGTGLRLTTSFPTAGAVDLRVVVTDSSPEPAGSQRAAIRRITVSSGFAGGPPNGAQARGAAADGATEGAATSPLDSADAARSEAGSAVPEALAVEAFPNPLASAATVRFGLPAAGAVTLVAYDVLGREVARLAEGVREAGWHRARFDASDLPSGLYVVRLTAGAHVETAQMTVLR